MAAVALQVVQLLGAAMPLVGHRILLVEDEALIALDLKSIIRKARGDVAAHAGSLARAMTLAHTPRLSLAILDFRLGTHTSLPAAAKLHALGVPLIFHTAGVASEISEAWPQVPIVLKPAAPARLISALLSLAADNSNGFGGSKAA
jgi:DNA-binding NarL/FixJ family response regulator